MPDCDAIIRAFHVANLVTRANVWFNYVATKANIADLPSRASQSPAALVEMAECLRAFVPTFSLERDVVPLAIPACPSGIAELWDAVMSQLSLPSGASSGGRRHRRGGARDHRGAKRPRSSS